MSDDNVVTFAGNKPADKNEYLLTCGACSCRTFNLFAGGYMKCSFCGECVHGEDAIDDARWRASIPDGPENPDNVPTADDGYVTKNDLPDSTLARRRTLKAIGAWQDDDHLVLVGGYNVRGEGRWWCDIKTEAQRDWMREKVAEILAWVDRVNLDASAELQIVKEDE